jgi:hypothetical protein
MQFRRTEQNGGPAALVMVTEVAAVDVPIFSEYPALKN